MIGSLLAAALYKVFWRLVAKR